MIDDLNIENLDNIMDLVDELLITKSRMENLDIFKGNNKDILTQLDRVTMELHHNIMKTRMIPLENIFLKIDKSLKNKLTGKIKKINLEFSRKEVEIDRGIIEEIRNILLNILNKLLLNAKKNRGSKKNNGKSIVGLRVGELLNQQDIVVKTMGELLKNVKNTSGATIIGMEKLL